MCLPEILCGKHLRGEHAELHKHRHAFVKRYSIKGRINPVVQIEPLSMKSRHDVLAKEMLRRGYRHCSPYELPDLSYLPLNELNATVDCDSALKDLLNRCKECMKRFNELNGVESK